VLTREWRWRHQGTPARQEREPCRSAPPSAAPVACHPANGRNRRAAPRHPYRDAATPTRARGLPPPRGAPTPGGSAATEDPSRETPPRPSPSANPTNGIVNRSPGTLVSSAEPRTTRRPAGWRVYPRTHVSNVERGTPRYDEASVTVYSGSTNRALGLAKGRSFGEEDPQTLLRGCVGPG
jgi:hypothetical protein